MPHEIFEIAFDKYKSNLGFVFVKPCRLALANGFLTISSKTGTLVNGHGRSGKNPKGTVSKNTSNRKEFEYINPTWIDEFVTQIDLH